jgi:hypothetical protein
MDKNVQNELIDEIKKLKDEIKRQNDENIKVNIIPNKNLRYYIKRYIQEVFEAIVSVLVFIFVLKKQFTLAEFTRIVSLIAFVTLILEEYNHDFFQNFKQGIHFTLGANAFT